MQGLLCFVLSVFLLGGGALGLSVYFGIIPAAVPADQRWVPAVMGGVLLVLGVSFLIFSAVEAVAGRFWQAGLERARFAFAVWIATLILTILGAAATWGAVYSWVPGFETRFSGGLTGTIYEHRIVWAVVAGILDPLALLFWLAILFGGLRAAWGDRK